MTVIRSAPWGWVFRGGQEDLTSSTLEWADWFNHRRLLEPIGNVPPADLEQAYYHQLEESAMAA